MTKIPLKAIRTGDDVTALGEYAAGDAVPIEHGGTGATTLEDAQTALGIIDASLLSAVALSGEYADLLNLPTLGTAAATDAGDYDPAGSATDAMSAHTAEFEHALIATALQPGDVADAVWGSITGSISSQTDLTPAAIGAAPTVHGHAHTAITGLGTAATTAATAYATAAQGVKADSALQSGAAISTISGLQTALDGKLATSGNAATATKLATARTLSLSGDVTGSASFDGSANATITAVIVDDSHNHVIANVDNLQTTLDGKSATTHNHTGVYEPADATILKNAAIGVTVQAYDADTAKLDTAQTWTAKQALSGGYEEAGPTLTQSSGDLTIPIDGKTYTFTPSEAITSITTTLPTAPACSGCTIYITQGATGYAVAYPAAWLWPNGMATPISTVANSVTRLVLSTDPAGNVHADADVRSAV